MDRNCSCLNRRSRERYFRGAAYEKLRSMKEGHEVVGRPSAVGMTLAELLATVGLAMSVYLLIVQA